MVNLAGVHLMNQENRREKDLLKGHVRTSVGVLDRGLKRQGGPTSD